MIASKSVNNINNMKQAPPHLTFKDEILYFWEFITKILQTSIV